MKPQSKSVNVQPAIPTVNDNIRKSNPRRRTIHDPWVWGALVVHSASTR
jgi:hypothetical protein